MSPQIPYSKTENQQWKLLYLATPKLHNTSKSSTSHVESAHVESPCGMTKTQTLKAKHALNLTLKTSLKMTKYRLTSPLFNRCFCNSVWQYSQFFSVGNKWLHYWLDIFTAFKLISNKRHLSRWEMGGLLMAGSQHFRKAPEMFLQHCIRQITFWIK